MVIQIKWRPNNYETEVWYLARVLNYYKRPLFDMIAERVFRWVFTKLLAHKFLSNTSKILLYHICSVYHRTYRLKHPFFRLFNLQSGCSNPSGIQVEKMRIFQEIWVYKEPTGVRNDHSRAKVLEEHFHWN